MEVHWTIVTLVTTVTVVTVLTVVTVKTVNRNKRVCEALHQFVSAIGIIKDSVGHGSVPCRPLFFFFGVFSDFF